METLLSIPSWLWLAIGSVFTFLLNTLEMLFFALNSSSLASFLKPGLWVYSQLGLVIDGQGDFVFVLWLSLYTWTLCARFIYVFVGRPLGLYNPKYYYLFFWVLPWRPFYRLWEKTAIIREEVFRLGRGQTAKTASLLSILARPYKPGYTLLGRASFMGLPLIQLCGQPSTKGKVLLGHAGSGKSSQLLTEISDHPGQHFLFDPKGDLTLAEYKRWGKGGGEIWGQGGNFQAIDPFGRLKDHFDSAHFNPFDVLEWAEQRFGSDAVVRFAAKMAEALVPMESNDKKHFPLSARDVVQSLVLLIQYYYPRELRNLVTLRRLLTEGLPDEAGPGQDPWDVLTQTMMMAEAYDGIIAQKIKMLVGGSDRGSADVLATARLALNFMDFLELRAISQRSTFNLVDLREINKKEGPLKLSLILPAGDTDDGPLAGYVRMITTLSLYIFENLTTSKPLKHGCKIILEEAPSVGHIAAVARCAPLMRSLSARLVFLAQDLAVMMKSYPKTWSSIFGNSEATVIAGANHEGTSQYGERMMGQKTRQVKVGGGMFSDERSHFSEKDYATMTADQIRRHTAKKNNIIVLPEGGRPMLLKAAHYYKELPVYNYSPSPDFREKPLRALTRFVLRTLVGLYQDLRTRIANRQLPSQEPQTLLLPDNSPAEYATS